MQQFNYIAELFVLGGIGSAIIIAADLRTCRQPMRIMNLVWVLTGLWASIFGLWAYYAFGRTKSCRREELSTGSVATNTDPDPTPGPTAESAQMNHMGSNTDAGPDLKDGVDRMPGLKMGTMEMPTEKMRGMPANSTKDLRIPHMKMPGMHTADMNMPGMDMGPKRPKWQSVVLSTLHCGAGCTLADIVGEWFLYFIPIAIGGSLIAGSWVFDYLLALIFGVGFQYAAIRGMERISRGKAVAQAAKADFLSLTAWQAGMYGWLTIVIYGFGQGALPARDTVHFWFLMQIAMACGFIVALPVNVLLIHLGIKKAM